MNDWQSQIKEIIIIFICCFQSNSVCSECASDLHRHPGCSGAQQVSHSSITTRGSFMTGWVSPLSIQFNSIIYFFYYKAQIVWRHQSTSNSLFDGQIQSIKLGFQLNECWRESLQNTEPTTCKHIKIIKIFIQLLLFRSLPLIAWPTLRWSVNLSDN